MINFELVSHLLIFSQFSRIIKTNYRHCCLLPGLEGSLVHRGDPAPLFYYSYLGTTWGEGQGLLHLKVSGQGPCFSFWGSSRPSASRKSWMWREWQGVLVSQGIPPPAGPPGVRDRPAKSSCHPHPRYSGEQGRWASRAVGHTASGCPRGAQSLGPPPPPDPV